MNLSECEWKKNWAGKWTLLECCYFGREYTKLLGDRYDIGPNHSLFTIEGGTSSNFLVPIEIEAFAKNLLEKTAKDEVAVIDWADEIIIRADEVLQFVRQPRQGVISYDDFKKLWQLLDEYLVIHFPIKKIVDYLPKDILEKVLPRLERARVYAEPVYAESLEFVKKFAENNSGDLGITPEIFLCMTDKELAVAFQGGLIPSIEILQERFSFSLVYVTKGEAEVVSGESARSLASMIYGTSTVKTLRGMTAFPGKVSGTVVIVLDPKEYDSLPPQSILVTGMTRPDYLHLFKDAIAVITDAGGILSHAAITARELQKPTVVGTEKATKVLKTGDRIEVDATAGVVQILSI